MIFGLDLHDSHISGSKVRGNSLEIELNEACLWVADAKGHWLEDEDHAVSGKIVVTEFTQSRDIGAEYIQSGELIGLGDKIFENVLPVNFTFNGQVTLHLQTDAGKIEIRGYGISIEVARGEIPKHLFSN